MPRRRILSAARKERALAEAERFRLALVQVCAEAPIHGPEYRAATAAKDAIDGLAEVLTGDRERFWTKPHSAGP